MLAHIYLIVARILLILVAVAADASGSAENPRAIEEVLSGKRPAANAAWWGFDDEDASDALQPAINSGAKRVVVPNMGKDWIMRPITLAGNQELVLEKGVVITAERPVQIHVGNADLTNEDLHERTKAATRAFDRAGQIRQGKTQDRLTLAERRMIDALVAQRISSVRADIEKEYDLAANIRELARRKHDFQAWMPAMGVAWCAKACRAKHVPLPSAINESVVDDVIWQYEHPYEGDPAEHRYECTRALGFIGDRKGVPYVLDSLRRGGGHQSWQGIEDLSDPRLLPAIEQRLDFTDQQDALPAISCLGNIGDVAIPALERFLKGNDRALRRSAAEALIRIGSQACLTALRQVAQSGDPDLVPEAQVGILRIQCRAIDRVYRHPRFPPEDELRLWHLAAIAMPGHDQTVRDGKMRARAEEVLVKLGTKAVGVLRLQLANRNHGDTRHGPVYFVTEYAAKILVRIGRPAVPCLIDALCDEQPHARAAAAQALQKITGHAHGADYAAWSTWFLKQTGRS